MYIQVYLDNIYIHSNTVHIQSDVWLITLLGVILRCLWGLEAYIYKMFMSSVEQCLLI